MRQTDAAGNVSSNSRRLRFTLDTTADGGGDLALSIGDTTINNAEKGAVAFTTSGIDGDVTSATVTFSDGIHSVTVNASAGVADLSTLTDGPVSSVLNVTDGAGNTASANGAAITLDTTAPSAPTPVAGDRQRQLEQRRDDQRRDGECRRAGVRGDLAVQHRRRGRTGRRAAARASRWSATAPRSVIVAADRHCRATCRRTSSTFSFTLDTTADGGGDLALSISDTSINNAEKGAVAFTTSGIDGDVTSATVTFSDGIHSVTVDASAGVADLSTLD